MKKENTTQKKHLYFRIILVSSVALIFVYGIFYQQVSSHTKRYEVNSIVNDYLKFQKIINSSIINTGNYHKYSYQKDEHDEDSKYWEEIIKNFTFKHIEDEMATYSLNIVENYKYLAQVYGIELEEYYRSILKLEEDEFYQLCYKEAMYDIEKYLLIGYIATEEFLDVTEKEIETFCKSNGYSYQEVIHDKELKNSIAYRILENKVIESLKENKNENIN